MSSKNLCLQPPKYYYHLARKEMDIRNSRFFVLFFGWAHPPLFLSDCSLQSATENAFPQSHSSSSGPHPRGPSINYVVSVGGGRVAPKTIYCIDLTLKKGRGSQKLPIMRRHSLWTVPSLPHAHLEKHARGQSQTTSISLVDQSSKVVGW